MNNGNTIPCIGFGTWKAPDNAITEEATRQAILAGYRHIDTAAVYKNEDAVGDGFQKGMKEAGLKREELFLTTKVWCNRKGYDAAMESVKESMRKLKVDYLDLLLIHWPADTASQADGSWAEKNRETWRAMEEMYKEGILKNIGLSNFWKEHIEALDYTIQPQVDQLENHPGYVQTEMIDYCKEHDILVEAWSSLGSGAVLADPFLNEIAQKYGKSTAQICVRFCLQLGILPLVKSVHADRIRSNAEVFDFELTEADMQAILSMQQTGFSGLRPDGKLPF